MIKETPHFLCPRLQTLYSVMDETISNICGQTVEKSQEDLNLGDATITSYRMNDYFQFFLTAKPGHISLSAYSGINSRNVELMQADQAPQGDHIVLIGKDGLEMTAGKPQTVPNAYENKQFSMVVDEAARGYLLDFTPRLT